MTTRRTLERKVLEQANKLRDAAWQTDDGMVEMKWDEWIHFADAVDALAAIESWEEVPSDDDPTNA